MKRTGLLLVGIAVLCCQAAGAAERILSFDSAIEVMRDGSMRVTEVITVKAERNRIKRGIYRDFPTDYQDRYGRRIKVDFEILAVTRDGAGEAYFTKPLNNGVRTYIGNKNVLLDPGEYTYALRYRTNRQLGFFENHDELYFNVTGTGWDFPIDRASATVTLPPGVPMDTVRHEAYTGRQGATGGDYTSELDEENRVVFATTRPLRPREGLTIVAMWPKGFVEEPDVATRLGWFTRDNRAWAIGIGGLLLLLGFYGLAWRAVGRDPPAGVIFPHYEPPEGYSPASMRFIRRMGYDHKTFATALVNLAVKGHVNIEEDDGEYTIEKQDNAVADLAPGEAVLMRRLLPGKRQELDRKYHKRIKKAINAHKRSLKNDYERIYFRTNSASFLIGGTISAVLFLAMVAQVADSLTGAIFSLIALSVIGLSGGKSLLALSVMFPATAGGRKAASWVGVLSTIAGLAFTCVFAYMFMTPLVQDPASRIGILLFATALLVTNGVFYQLMKAPTRIGRRLLDKIGGFEEYLTVAEEEDLKLRNPPKRTPALFEKYLPYAMALDAEGIWGEKFTAVLGAAEVDGTYTRPGWYHGSNWNSSSGPAAFAGAVATSLAASAAAASTPPGSSGGYGGGGGGSSGGGGGGGGGGGW